LRVELINIFTSEVLCHILDIGLFIVGAKQQIRESVEPCLMSLSGRAGKLDSSARRDDDQALAVESWRAGVIVGNDTDRLDGNTLGLQLCASSS
jgi:hypothetical protein